MKKMYTIFILLLGVFNLSCSESKTGTYSENKTEKNIFNTIVDTISGAKFEYNVAESTPDTFNLVHLFLPESYDAQLLNDKHPENIRGHMKQSFITSFLTFYLKDLSELMKMGK